MVEAARTLFLERGFAATTIESISAAAEVPAPSVYRLFGSKVGILKALLDSSIGGDDRPVAVQERPDVAGLFAEPDPVALLEGFAGVARAINERSNELYTMLVGAARSEPAAAVLLGELQEQRSRGQRGIARALDRHGALRPGLREREASDLIHALMSPELYRLLVTDRRWSPGKYETWLATTLIQQLTEEVR